MVALHYLSIRFRLVISFSHILIGVHTDMSNAVYVRTLFLCVYVGTLTYKNSFLSNLL